MPLPRIIGCGITTRSIVAIHGLNPWNNEEHATDTWEEKKSGNLWLRDQLPSEQPEARTMLYEYNSSPAFSVDKERFIFQANDLLEDLRLERSLVSQQRPNIRQISMIPSADQGMFCRIP
jgi:hypothetical protein